MTNLPQMIEPLESRIAPALVIANPIFDITAATGQKGASIDLGKLVDPSKSYRTTIELVTNFTLPGQSQPGVIQIQLFDDKAPETVANFLRYLNNPNKSADYDGVIFHRLVQGFVLQGGGFNASDFLDQKHLSTFPTVHNEYDPNDPERSNIVQTVAMAKVASGTGGGPNSASSEFFINLADNSSNLNAQNGGFTVFGRVTDASMPVVNAIAGLQLYNSSAPVQNFSGGVPTENQLITITDAHVVPPGLGDDGGATFAIDSITDATTGLPSKLVTTKLNPETNQLDLKFAPNASGVVNVKVKVSKTGEPDVFDEFKVTVEPNLITDVVADGLKSTIVPGDTGTAKVSLVNNGGALAKGKVNVKLYLSKSNGALDDTDKGFTLETDGADPDVLVGELDNVSINVAAGKAATLAVKYKVPSTGLADGSKYRLLAVVETPTGSKVVELHSDDNVGNFTKENTSLTDSSVLHQFALAFGTVGGRSNVPITVKDGSNNDVTLRLTGPGSGAVTKNSDGTVDITLTGTTAASTLKLTAGKGIVANIDDLFINDTIGSVSLGNTHLHGHLTASGGAKSLIFGDLGNTSDDPLQDIDKTISIGIFPVATQKLALSLGEVHDYSLISDMPIGSVLAKTWVNAEATTGANTIGAPSIGTLKIAGDLEASVVTVDSTKLGVFSVGGSLHGVTVRTTGDVGTVTVGDLEGSQFLVGLTAQPDEISDFVTGKTITSFTVKGTMSDSVIAAAKITTATVAAVDGVAGSTTKGIFADAIKSYLHKGFPKELNLDAPAVVETVGNYTVQVF